MVELLCLMKGLHMQPPHLRNEAPPDRNAIGYDTALELAPTAKRFSPMAVTRTAASGEERFKIYPRRPLPDVSDEDRLAEIAVVGELVEHE